VASEERRQLSLDDFLLVGVRQTIDLGLDLVAPTTPGSYRGDWLLKSDIGKLFGLGPNANQPIWVRIQVAVPPTATPSATFTPSPTSTFTLTPSLTPTLTPTSTATYTPTLTPSVAPTQTPNPPTAQPRCDQAAFVADVTVPDGMVFTSGGTVTKTWRLRNTGSCTWTTSYTLVFVSGDKMNGPDAVKLSQSIAPGQNVDLTVKLTAPSTPGTYRGNWELKNESGAIFGLGPSFKPFWVEIKVLPALSEDGSYDFATNLCAAQWSSAAGDLPCPGDRNSSNGFALRVENPRLEDGSTLPTDGLLLVPQNTFNGYVQGEYPAIKIEKGDRFQSLVSCGQSPSCFVAYLLEYQIGSGPFNSYWIFIERNDGIYAQADVDLSALAGKEVRFRLRVLSLGSATGDEAYWIRPRIVRSKETSTP